MNSLEKSTGFLVVRTARSMKKMLDARLSEFGITSSQHTILNALAENDGISLSAIGKMVFLDKPAITGLADRLEKDGLVERKRNSEDRRVIKLHLTGKGRDLHSRLENVVFEVDRQLVEILSESELEKFRITLARIWTHADERSV